MYLCLEHESKDDSNNGAKECSDTSCYNFTTCIGCSSDSGSIGTTCDWFGDNFFGGWSDVGWIDRWGGYPWVRGNWVDTRAGGCIENTCDTGITFFCGDNGRTTKEAISDFLSGTFSTGCIAWSIMYFICLWPSA